MQQRQRLLLQRCHTCRKLHIKHKSLLGVKGELLFLRKVSGFSISQSMLDKHLLTYGRMYTQSNVVPALNYATRRRDVWESNFNTFSAYTRWWRQVRFKPTQIYPRRKRRKPGTNWTIDLEDASAVQHAVVNRYPGSYSCRKSNHGHSARSLLSYPAHTHRHMQASGGCCAKNSLGENM